MKKGSFNKRRRINTARENSEKYKVEDPLVNEQEEQNSSDTDITNNNSEKSISMYSGRNIPFSGANSAVALNESAVSYASTSASTVACQRLVTGYKEIYNAAEHDNLQKESITEDEFYRAKAWEFVMRDVVSEQLDQAVLVYDSLMHRILWCNNKMSILFGIPNLVGQDILILMAPELAKRHHTVMDNYHEIWRKEGRSPLSSIINEDSVHTAYKRDIQTGQSSPISVKIRIIPIVNPDYPEKVPTLYSAIIKGNILEEYYNDSLNIYSLIFNKINEPVVQIDLTTGIIEKMNPAAQKMFGIPINFFEEKFHVNDLMPENIAKNHARYLRIFKDNLIAGRGTGSSSIVGVSRRLMGIRRIPGWGKVEVPLELNVHLVDTDKNIDPDRIKLIGVFRDLRKFMDENEIYELLAKNMFPKCLRKTYLSFRAENNGILSNKELKIEVSQKTVVFTDITDFTRKSVTMGNERTVNMLLLMYRFLSDVTNSFGGDLIKFTGDGGMMLFGGVNSDSQNEKNSKSCLSNAVVCAMAIQIWAQKNNIELRVGVHYGNVTACIFFDDYGVPKFDIVGSDVNYASRMESTAEPGTIQLSDIAYKKMNRLKLSEEAGVIHSLFEKQRKLIKGYDVRSVSQDSLIEELSSADILPDTPAPKKEEVSEDKRINQRRASFGSIDDGRQESEENVLEKEVYQSTSKLIPYDSFVLYRQRKTMLHLKEMEEQELKLYNQQSLADEKERSLLR